MSGSKRSSVRTLLLVLLGLFCVLLDVSTAYAQSAACIQLEGQLAQVERSGGGRRGGNSARDLARAVQDAESQYIRQGCNDDARAGRTLTRQCQQIGRNVLDLREQYAQASQAADSANVVARQREAILQELARFGCGAGGSSATFSNDRQNIFDRIFGTTTQGDFSDGTFVDNGWNSSSGYQTIRTLCVRLSDGYFWPISYATLPDYLYNDADTCRASCPTTQVDLYYYNNPGEEVEQMRNQFGEPYSRLPTAFAYRDKIDPAITCKVPAAAEAGSSIVSIDANGEQRAVTTVQDVTFPLPLRDPRGQTPIPAAPAPELVAATVLDVPLPRPRPAGPGETPISRPAQAVEDESLRLVQFGNKVVRVVGPDTPYAQPVAAGS